MSDIDLKTIPDKIKYQFMRLYEMNLDIAKKEKESILGADVTNSADNPKSSLKGKSAINVVNERES